jgi:hypothetical protein
MTMPEWMYETLSNDPLRVYEDGNGKIIISQVADRYPELIMSPEDIIKFLKGVRKKPVVMKPESFEGRHVAKKDIIAVLSERIMTQLEGGE